MNKTTAEYRVIARNKQTGGFRINRIGNVAKPYFTSREKAEAYAKEMEIVFEREGKTEMYDRPVIEVRYTTEWEDIA